MEEAEVTKNIEHYSCFFFYMCMSQLAGHLGSVEEEVCDDQFLLSLFDSCFVLSYLFI